MATIEKRKQSDGSISYRVMIRKKNTEIYKTFRNEEDAKLYAIYKERLIDNKEAFEVPIKDRVTLRQITELKVSSLKKFDPRNTPQFTNSCNRFSSIFGDDKFLCDLTYEDWLNAAKIFSEMDVYKGVVSDKGRRKMSLETLRRIFADISSCISFAQSKGIAIDNHALKVVQTFIYPKIKAQKELCSSSS